MLGSLARWLRLAGYDVWYDARAEDRELTRLSRLTGRVLLTRDRALASSRGIRVLYIQAQKVQEQLAQVLRAFPPQSESAIQPRCSRCNQPLVEVDKYEVEGLVPPFVWVNQQRFWRCPVCHNVYWRGSHWQHFSLCLREAARASV